MPSKSLQSLRLRVYRQLEVRAWRGKGLSPANRALVVLILLAVAAAVVETEPTISGGRYIFFANLEILFGVIFLVEYCARLWIAVDNPHFAGYRFPRLRYAVSPIAIIDLAAIIPAFVAVGGGSTFFLRFFRMFRMIRLAKLGRTSSAWVAIREAVLERRYEFGLVLGLVAVAMLISASLLYWTEADAQPEKFGSIPRALWWSIVTLTTVGYGDAFPVTPLGQLFAGLFAVVGIMLIAIPTGIFAASFSDGLQRHRERRERGEDPDD